MIGHNVGARYYKNIGDARGNYLVTVTSDFSAACPHSTFTVTTTEHPNSHIYGYDADTRIFYLYSEDNGDAAAEGYYNFDFRFEMTTNPANFWTWTAKVYFIETCIG